MTFRFCPHCSGALDHPDIVTWGGWSLDEVKGILEPGGVYLTRTRAAIIGALLRAEGRVVSREGGLYAIVTFGKSTDEWPSMEVVDQHICGIRRVLRVAFGRDAFGRDALVSSRHGIGYYATPFGETVLLACPQPKARRAS